MHLLQHLAVFEYFVLVSVTALAGGVSTAILRRGAATVIAILQTMEAVSFPTDQEAPRLLDTTGPSAVVATVHRTCMDSYIRSPGCFHQVATVLQAQHATASHEDGRSEKGDVD